MLTSSILQILANSLEQLQQKPVEGAPDEFRTEMLAAIARDASGKAMEKPVQSGEASTNSFASEDRPGATPPGPSLEGLIQMVNKLQKEDQSRVVDVFE